MAFGHDAPCPVDVIWREGREAYSLLAGNVTGKSLLSSC